MAETEQTPTPEPFEKQLEKELYKGRASKRIGRVKKIWGVRHKEPEVEEFWQERFEHLVPSRGFPLGKLFLAALVLFIISSIIFGFVVYYRRLFVSGVDVSITGPTETEALVSNNYIFRISNNANLSIEEVTLKIELGEGAYFADKPQERSQTFSIGQIISRTNSEVALPLLFVGERNKVVQIKTTLIYLTPKRNQKFELERTAAVTISREPFTIQSFLPNQILINEPFAISFRATNISTQPYELRLNISLPQGIELIEADPPTDGYLSWRFDSLQPQAIADMRLVVQANSIPLASVIKITPVIRLNENDFSFNEIPIAFKVLDSPIVFKVLSRPEENVVDLDQELTYTLSWLNKSSVSLEDVKIKVFLEGFFNLNSLNTDGYFSPIENALIWDARNKPELLKLPPRAEGSARFLIKTSSAYPLSSPDKKNFVAKVVARMETSSIPPEIQTVSPKISWQVIDQKRVTGQLTVTPSILYQDAAINNYGPFPFERGKPTALTVHLQVKTMAEDFQNFVVKTKIPVGVRLTGVWAGDFNPAYLSYNQTTGEFVYRVQQLPANLGFGLRPLDLAFQIEVTPPLYGNFMNFVFLPSMEISAQGQWSQKNFKIVTKNFRLIDTVTDLSR
jgi:hypothetical protein